MIPVVQTSQAGVGGGTTMPAMNNTSLKKKRKLNIWGKLLVRSLIINRKHIVNSEKMQKYRC